MKTCQGLLLKLVVTFRRLPENDDLTRAAVEGIHAYHSVDPDFYLDK